ncbi:terpenoid synthase [Daedaleopsis nitida]|nr:terpenoid synthase [Daedaleopsis nitida]
MASWPLARRVSPFYDEVAASSAEWLRGFHAFGPEAQRAFDQIKPGLLVALTFPEAEEGETPFALPRPTADVLDEEHFRAACNLMNLLFVFDEYTDDLCERDAQELADISMDALRDPSKARAAGESVVGEITRQFWSHATQHASETSRIRLEGAWDRFTMSLVEQARDRDEGRLRTVEEHMMLRRLTIGTEPFYALAALALDLPQEAWGHPIIQSLHADITDIIFLDNDLSSYKKEQAAGDDQHNVITVAMREYGLDLDGAVRWLADRHKARVDHAIAAWRQALDPSSDVSPEMSDKLVAYVNHIMNWPRGNDCWNFESGRYFGRDGLRVQAQRVVELLPTGQRELQRVAISA